MSLNIIESRSTLAVSIVSNTLVDDIKNLHRNTVNFKLEHNVRVTLLKGINAAAFCFGSGLFQCCHSHIHLSLSSKDKHVYMYLYFTRIDSNWMSTRMFTNARNFLNVHVCT